MREEGPKVLETGSRGGTESGNAQQPGLEAKHLEAQMSRAGASVQGMGVNQPARGERGGPERTAI